MPISRQRSMISSLLKPSSGRRIGSSIGAEMAARFWGVWDETWPIASPVTRALSWSCRARDSAAREHQPLEHHLPVALGHPGLERLDHRPEVDRIEPRPVAVAPLLGDHLHHPQHAELVGGAAQVEEDVVQGDAAAEHHPGRHRRVEAAGDQRQRPPLGAQGEARRPQDLLQEVVGLGLVDLDRGGDLRVVQVHRVGVGQERRPQLPLHVLRAEGDPLAVTRAPGADREAPAGDRSAEELVAGVDDVGQVRPRPAVDRRVGLDAEGAADHLPGQGRGRVDVDAAPAAVDRRLDSGALEPVAEVSHQPLGEADPGLRGLGGDLAGEPDQVELAGHGGKAV